MPDKLEIRNLTDQDIIPVVRICNQTFLEGARYPDIGAIPVNGLEKHPDWQWGAFIDGQLAGFAIGLPHEKENGVHLRLIGIDPAFRSRGLGTRLLAVLEEKARGDKRDYIDLGTPYARDFYEKNGYSIRRITYRMIRDITQQSITLPEDARTEPLMLDHIPELTDAIRDQGDRLRILKQYLRMYGNGSGLLIRVTRGGRVAGVVLGKENRRMPDLVQVELWHAVDPEERRLLVQAIEYMVSTRGLRYVGFDADENEYKEFESWGYTVSHEDYFWTQYTMEKRL